MSGTLALIPIKEWLKHCQNVGLKSEYYLLEIRPDRVQFCRKNTLCTIMHKVTAFAFSLHNGMESIQKDNGKRYLFVCLFVCLLVLFVYNLQGSSCRDDL